MAQFILNCAIFFIKMQRYFLIILAAIVVLEFYVYLAIKTLTANIGIRYTYIGINAVVYLFLFYNILNFSRGSRDYHPLEFIVTVFLIFLLPKILVALFLLIDDIGRLLIFTAKKFSGDTGHYPERRRFLSIMGLGFGGALSFLFLDGVIFGKYRHKVRRVKVKIKNLPYSFKGYKIVQISDVHSGSFFHPKKLQHAFDLINEQKADLLLFTGDMVNNYAEELRPFIPYFQKIKVNDGKFSVLGNHDYGLYGEWKSLREQQQNLQQLKVMQAEAGFRMLNNEHAVIERNGEKLYIIGVENWGEKPFPQYGDLDKATADIPQQAAKILMSHDPTHFDRVVKFHHSDISLTLSGHTHGMQFGLDLKNIKWSPVQYRYPKWADLYESEGKLLYVNRGFGVLAYPGRVGVLPEITVFELH